MQTFKTAVVVVLLLGVCYGAYVALNAPEPTLPDSLQDWNEDAMALDVSNGAAVDIPQLAKTPGPDALDSLAVAPPPSSQTPSNTPSLTLSGSSVPINETPKAPELKLPSAPVLPSDTKADVPDLVAETNKESNKEGDSIPLPTLGGSELSLPKAPGTLASLSTPSNETASGDAAPSLSLPKFPGQDDSTADPGTANPPADFPGSSLAAQDPAATKAATPEPVGGTASVKLDPAKSASKSSVPFAQARDQALKMANDGKLKEALAMMSPYYNNIELTHEEFLDLRDLLDALAGEVIYSRRHFLEPKFVVSPGDTLESIANKYRISPEVLASINRMGESRVVLAGTEMKVLTGPFRAEVAVTKGELTVFLGGLYAGKFSISVGKEPFPAEGNYSIVERRRDRSYVGPDSKFMAANDPRNPYGGYWMHLGNNISIHGSPEVPTPESPNAGCISLAPLDAKEVYVLLTQGSEVVIKR